MVVPPERLIDMPLHEITEALGEDGLRARFALESGRFDPPDRRRLTEALGLAAHLHRHDRRVHEPYLNHLLRVALRIVCHYQVTDADVVVAALLHDTVEDHGSELAAAPERGRWHETVQAALDVLAEQFGPRVAEIVGAVTNPDFTGARDPDELYREHVATSLDNHPWARVVKISDFTDNGLGVVHITGPKVLRVARKYRPLVPVLRELVGRPDTPLSQWAKRHVLDQLDLAEERFRDILDHHGPRVAAVPKPDATPA